jgi:molybdenum cofactor sulfurtransferase
MDRDDQHVARTTEAGLPPLEEALAGFLTAYPAYARTQVLDRLRATEYRRLDDPGHTYLDYTGASLYGDFQVRAHMALLGREVFGNPHSASPSSHATTRLIEQTRTTVLGFFNANPDEYAVVFTPNATGALKLVGEAYPFAPDGRYLLTFDNHNSVNGIREYARACGAEVTYVPLVLPEMDADEAFLDAQLARGAREGPGLFAYPAQSNFSGVQHPLEWIDRAHRFGWDVLLDAAAFVPTNRLDLARWKPDFVTVSFYKMFGYPTGVGGLLARREALARLRRPWFAGGTITVASVRGDRYVLAPGEAAFEDGTPNYLAIPAVEIGLRHLMAVGIETIHDRVQSLTGWILARLLAMNHRTGVPLIRVYGPAGTDRRGATIAMNFFDPQGRFIDHRTVEAVAGRANISLRTGCFCNPGAGETALELSRTDLVGCFNRVGGRMTMDDFRRCIDGRSTGAVRISLGLASNFADAYRFVQFAETFLDSAVLDA